MSGLNTVAKLSLIVDTSQVEDANKHLDKLSDIAGKVEASGNKITDSLESTAKAAKDSSTEQEKLVAKLLEMTETYNQGREGVIEYRAALMGAADVVKPLVDQYRQMKESVDAHNQVIKEQTREEAKLEKERARLTAQHKEMMDTYGMSRDEIRLYRLEQAGLIEQAAEYRQLLQDNSAQAKAVEQQRIATKEIEEQKKALRDLVDAFNSVENSIKKAETVNIDIDGVKAELKELQETMQQLDKLGDTKGLIEVEKKVVALEESLAKTADPKKKNEMAKLSEEFAKMRGRVDPVQGALHKLYEELERVAEAKKNVGKEGFQFNLEEIEEVERKLNQQIETYDKMGDKIAKTPKELAFAMRGLPAQFTDIFTSLQAGHNPLLVLTQQGGQIKDSFGGVGMAARQMGTYITGLITPVNLTVASLGLLAFTAAAGTLEQNKLQQAISLSGRGFETSSNQIRESARLLKSDMSTLATATETVLEVFNADNINPELFNDIIGSVSAYAAMSGKNVKELVQQYEQLGKEPVRAAIELNKQHRFLTSSLLSNILELERLGKTYDSSKLSQEALAKSQEVSAIEAEMQLKTLSRMTMGFAQGMKDLGTNIKQTFWSNAVDSLEELEARIQNTTNLLEEFKRSYGDTPNHPMIMELQSRLDDLNSKYEKLKESASDPEGKMSSGAASAVASINNLIRAEENHHQKFERQKNELIGWWQTIADEGAATVEIAKQYEAAVLAISAAHAKAMYSSPYQSMIRDLDNLNQKAALEIQKNRSLTSIESQRLRLQQDLLEIQERQRTGGDAAISDLEKEMLLNKEQLFIRLDIAESLEKQRNAQIELNRETSKGSRAGMSRVSEGDRLVRQLVERHNQLKLILSTNQQLGKEELELEKSKGEFARLEALRGKRKLTDQEDYLLSLKDEILAQHVLNVEAEKSVRLRDEQNRLSRTVLEYDKQLYAQQRSIDLTKEGLWLLSKEKTERAELAKLEDDHYEKRKDLDSKLSLGDITQTEYSGELQALDEFYNARREMMLEFHAWQTELEEDGWAGIVEGFTRFEDSVDSIHDRLANFTESSLRTFSDGMADALTNAIVLGDDLRTSFHNIGLAIVQSAVKSMIQLGIETLMVQAIQVGKARTVAAAEKSAILSTKATAMAAASETAASQSAAAATTTSSWTPAAMMASIGSFGSAAAIGMAAVVAALAFKGFKTGGYTGGGGVNDIAGVVHGQEYVFDAASTSRIGVENLERIRRGESVGGSEKGGGALVVNTSVVVEASAGVSEEDARMQGEQVANATRAVVINVLEQESRAGGMLWQNFGGGR